MNPSEKLSHLLAQRMKLKAQSSVFYSKYAELRAKQSETEAEIKAELMGIGTRKFESLDQKFLATLVDNDPTFQISDEKATIKWLETHNAPLERIIGIRKEEFNPFARTILKETGEVPDGAAVSVTQSLRITERKEKAQKEQAISGNSPSN